MMPCVEETSKQIVAETDKQIVLFISKCGLVEPNCFQVHNDLIQVQL